MGWKMFDFYCGKCEAVFEGMVQGDPKTLACPDCKSKMKRMMPAASIVTTDTRARAFTQQGKDNIRKGRNKA